MMVVLELETRERERKAGHRKRKKEQAWLGFVCRRARRVGGVEGEERNKSFAGQYYKGGTPKLGW